MIGGGTLELTTDYPPAESPHTITVYSKDLNALFLADFGYNKVHLWMGDDIDNRRIATWRAELVRIKSRYARAQSDRVSGTRGSDGYVACSIR